MFQEALSTEVNHLLKRIGNLSIFKEFYLGGGSAAALHLGHRISKDLDFFTASPFSGTGLQQILSQIEKPHVHHEEPGTLVLMLGQVPVSFFEYPAKLLKATQLWKNLRVASLLDIALMKIVAIGQRGARRDFVDFYYIMQSREWTLENLLGKISEKYPQISYSSYHFIRSLTYFDDAEKEPHPQMLDTQYDWARIETYFRETMQSLGKNI